MSTSIDQQFVEFVVESLVSKPEAVQVERRIDEKGVLLELTVDPEDLGRVIGKRGATAQSLRTLLRALGTKNDARYNLKIIDNGEPGAHTSAPRRDDSGMRSSDDHRSNSSAQMPSGAPSDGDEIDEPESLPKEKEPSAGSDRLARTRKELEELDDLDV